MSGSDLTAAAQKSTARMVAVSKRLRRLNRPKPGILFRPPGWCLVWRRAMERRRLDSLLLLLWPARCLVACPLLCCSCSIHAQDPLCRDHFANSDCNLTSW